MEIIFAAAIAGLMGSPHCIGMCGGFAAACARPRGSVVLWHAGRLSSYAVLGAAGGLAGGALSGPRWLAPAVSLVLLAWFAASLAQLVPQPKVALPGVVKAGVSLARREGPLARYLFGIATGLLPCGLVYAALALAIAAGTPLAGAAAMIAFGLGTAPALSLLSVGVRSFAARGVWQRRAVAVVVLAAGVWSIARRPEGPVMHGSGDVPAAAHSPSHHSPAQ